MTSPPPWDKARILRHLRKLHQAGADVSATGMLTRNRKLGHRIYHLFGTHSQALRQAGIAPEKVTRLKRYSKADVLARLRTRRDQGESLSFAALEREEPGLYSLALHKFGSYARAMARLGLDVNEVRQLRRWTRQSLIAKLRELHRQGLDLRCLQLVHGHAGVVSSATRRFGSWAKALQAAGLPQPPRKKPERYRTMLWPRERVLDALRRRHAQGQAIYSAALLREAPKLYYGACRRFGRLNAALVAAGLPLPTEGFGTRWDKPALIARLQQVAAGGTALTQEALKQAGHNQLLTAGRRLFGTFQAAIEAAGLLYPVPRGRMPLWTRPTVQATLQRLAAQDRSLVAPAQMARHHQGLYWACHRFYGGNYARALQAAGIQGVPCGQRRWTPEAMIAALQERHQKGLDMRASVVARQMGGLVVALRQHWKTYDRALAAAGVPVPALKPLAAWPWPEVVRQIQVLAAANEDLRSTAVRQQRQGLYFAARYYFGGWRQAVAAAGLRYRKLVQAAVAAEIAAAQRKGGRAS